MADNFKKFIDTGGKSIEEIRKQIGKLLSKTAETVARDIGKEVKKEVKKEFKKEVGNTVRGVVKNVSDRFGAFGTFEVKNRTITLEDDDIAYPPERVEENLSPHDIMINEAILGMRMKKQTPYNGRVVQRCSEITFVLQGEYVADIEDDFSRNAFFGMTTPMYAAMSNSQLRTYFTWRTDVRRGVYNDTDRAYVVLYIFELLNKIGVHSSDEAFSKLVELWNNIKGKSAYNFLPRLLKDFYAYNNVSGEFPECLCTSEENSQRKAAVGISTGDYKNKLELLANYSAYNIKQSAFWSENTAPIIDGALEEVLKELNVYFSAGGIALDSLICGQMKKDHAWRQFSGAIVCLDRMDGFREVRISPEESYCKKRGEPTHEEFSFQPQRGITGYILKSIEARLRIRTGFGRKISVNAAMLLNDVKNRQKAEEAVTNEEFKKVIERAVDRFCDKNMIFPKKKETGKNSFEEEDVYVAPKVEIDISKLSDIRRKADEIAEKLIAYEEAPNFEAQTEYGLDEGVDISDIEDKTRQIYDDNFSERISDYTALADEKSGWEGFSQKLSDIERGLLSVMYEKGDCAGYCREKGEFLETLAESINNCALEYIGDIIIEDGDIISDYMTDIETVLKDK